MTEEEKKAIEYLENRLDILHNNTQWATEESIKVVLNLIEKQQEEIEKLENDKRGILVELYKANDKKDKIKDKNASLKKEIKLMKSININDNYISKDKIRKLKEYYEDSLKYAENEIESNNIYVSIKILEKLLEE